MRKQQAQAIKKAKNKGSKDAQCETGECPVTVAELEKIRLTFSSLSLELLVVSQ